MNEDKVDFEEKKVNCVEEKVYFETKKVYIQDAKVDIEEVLFGRVAISLQKILLISKDFLKSLVLMKYLEEVQLWNFLN